MYVQLKWVSLVVLSIGFISRVYLAAILPIWHDEAYSIWTSQTSVSNIIQGISDPVHPPGYYLFLKFWIQISDHLFWLRLSSIFLFAINGYLLYLLSKKISDIHAAIVLFLYSFSGYFVVFDWQTRMYTGALTFILLSLSQLCHGKQMIRIILFTFINALGLYFDYAFAWYFFPLMLYLVYQCIKKKDYESTLLVVSCAMSFALFGIWLPYFVKVYAQGMGGISWMISYLTPVFSIPYLLGTHDNGLVFSGLYFILVTGGVYLYVGAKRKNSIIDKLICSVLLVYLSYVYSIVKSPIFHLRSVEIIGLIFIFFVAEALHYLYQRKSYYLMLIIVWCIFINYFLVVMGLIQKPGQYLVSPFPWKRLMQISVRPDTNTIVYRKTKELQSDKLMWGLVYTLDGKESLFAKKISNRDISGISYDVAQCRLISDQLLEIYGCK